MRYDDIVPTMLRHLPGLGPAYHREISQYGEDLGVYVVLGNVLVPFLRMAITAGGNKGDLEKAFSLLEEMASSSDIEVRNALAVGVCELLGPDHEILVKSYEYMGPGTRKASDEIEAFWHPAETTTPK